MSNHDPAVITVYEQAWEVFIGRDSQGNRLRTGVLIQLHETSASKTAKVHGAGGGEMSAEALRELATKANEVADWLDGTGGPPA